MNERVGLLNKHTDKTHEDTERKTEGWMDEWADRPTKQT